MLHALQASQLFVLQQKLSTQLPELHVLAVAAVQAEPFGLRPQLLGVVPWQVWGARQSASVTHVTLQALAPQMYGVQDDPVAVAQLPLPLQFDEGVYVDPVQLDAPQGMPVSACWHVPLPVQFPVLPQGMLFETGHFPCNSGCPDGMLAQDAGAAGHVARLAHRARCGRAANAIDAAEAAEAVLGYRAALARPREVSALVRLRIAALPRLALRVDGASRVAPGRAVARERRARTGRGRFAGSGAVARARIGECDRSGRAAGADADGARRVLRAGARLRCRRRWCRTTRPPGPCRSRSDPAGRSGRCCRSRRAPPTRCTTCTCRCSSSSSRRPGCRSLTCTRSPAEHVRPGSFNPHELFPQVFGDEQSLLLAHAALHAPVPQRNGAHELEAGFTHLPAPSQLDLPVNVVDPLGQLASAQVVPLAYFWQAPAWHLPLVPQLAAPVSLQMPAGSAVPFATLVHAPRLPVRLQDWQAPPQAELQQTPCAQKPLLHCESARAGGPVAGLAARVRGAPVRRQALRVGGARLEALAAVTDVRGARQRIWASRTCRRRRRSTAACRCWTRSSRTCRSRP